MTQPDRTAKPHHLKYAYAFKFKRGFAYLLVCAEQFTRGLWRIVFWTLFFTGLWMLRLPDLFERPGLYAASLIFFGGIGYFLWRDFRHFRWPTRRQVIRRMERESALKHRPLSEMDDTPVTSHTPQSYELWALEQQRRARDIKKIRYIGWRESLSTYDPRGLRLLAALFCCAGVFVAGSDWKNRIIQGLLPLDWYGTGSNIPPIVVTITPPEYTGLPQNVLQAGVKQAEIVKIPAGSRIKVLMGGAILHPDVGNMGQTTPMEAIEGGGYALEWVAQAPEQEKDTQPSGEDTAKQEDIHHLSVRQFLFTNFDLPYTILPDTAPVIALQDMDKDEIAALEKERLEQAEWQILRRKMQAVLDKEEAGDAHDDGDARNDGDATPGEDTAKQQAPQATPQPPDDDDGLTLEDIRKEAATSAADKPPSHQRQPKILPDGQIQIPLKLFDDYGVATLTMTMTLADSVADPPLGHNVTEERSVMSPAGKDFSIAPVYDFTNNPWAGLPAKIDLHVTDQIGQTTHLQTLDITLPERTFQHPVARQLVAMRKKLAWAPDAAIARVHYELDRLLRFPEDFQNDITTYLALSLAAYRLEHSAPTQDASAPESRAVMALLWDTALRIEGGNLSIAARNLRYAQMALEAALRDGELPPERITGLMAELRQAMGAYLLEFKKELQKQFAEGAELLLTPEALDELMNPEALAQFLGKMESEMRGGNPMRAQAMLSQLQRMLDMLNPNMALPMPEDMQQMADNVNEMQLLVENQKALKNQTQSQSDAQDNQGSADIGSDFGLLLPDNADLFSQWGVQDLPPPPSAGITPRIPPSLSTALNRGEQEALRYVLGRLMLDTDRFLGNIPEKLGLAEREMLFSGDELHINKPSRSIPHQDLAIQYLTEAQKQMQEELQKRIEQMTGGGNGDEQKMPGGNSMKEFSERFSQNQGRRYDPLGRPVDEGQGGGEGENNAMDDSSVKIPDEAERKRVEEILKLLRDRSGELYRPRDELEYFRRLLRQF